MITHSQSLIPLAKIQDYSHLDAHLTALFPQRDIRRILLILPPDANSNLFNYQTAKSGRYWNFPPYGLGIIARQLLSINIQVDILNLNHELLKYVNNDQDEKAFEFEIVLNQLIQERLISFNPELVGISCMFTQTHSVTMIVSNIIKSTNPNTVIAVGGVHITNSLSEEKTKQSLLQDFSMVDLFFLYEAEISFRNFVQIVNRKKPLSVLSQLIINGWKDEFTAQNRPAEQDTNIIPTFNYMDLDNMSTVGKIGSFYVLKPSQTRFATILANRGCRAKCTFCSVNRFNGRGVRHKSIQTLITELTQLRDEFGITHVMWLDDDLFHDKHQKIKLFNEMVKKNIGITWDCTNGVIASSCTPELISAANDSGCIGLNIGVESGNARILKLIKKPGTVEIFLKAAQTLRMFPQINTRVFLMIGFPYETLQMIEETANLAIEMDLDWYNITTFQPLPNTELFEQLNGMSQLDTTNFWDLRYNSGPYGRIREKSQNSQIQNLNYLPFSQDNKDQIPKTEQMETIWFHMNYILNFDRLRKVTNPIKLDQQFKYVQNIADLVAPDDAFAMYFYAYLQQKVRGKIDANLVQRLNAKVADSTYWQSRFKQYNLSIQEVNTGHFTN